MPQSALINTPTQLLEIIRYELSERWCILDACPLELECPEWDGKCLFDNGWVGHGAVSPDHIAGQLSGFLFDVFGFEPKTAITSGGSVQLQFVDVLPQTSEGVAQSLARYQAYRLSQHEDPSDVLALVSSAPETAQ